MLGGLWRLLLDLVRDLPGTAKKADANAKADAKAQDDDVLDAMLDEEGMDATGL